MTDDSTPKALTYGSHLNLDRILTAQQPVSDSHDEMLFLIQHQTSELWFRLLLAELDQARACLSDDRLRMAIKALRRSEVVLSHLVASWEVLRTLGPTDFAAFRGSLGTASGFQSVQYRMVEFVLGNRVSDMVSAHADDADALARLNAELSRPSLYEAAVRAAGRRIDVQLPADLFAPGSPHASDPRIAALWTRVYRVQDEFPDLFDLAECLVAIEDRFRCWRFNHVTTVERVIGFKAGTGGTSGVGYLRHMLDVELFPELWRLRTVL